MNTFTEIDYAILRETLLSFRSKVKIASATIKQADRKKKLKEIEDAIKFAVNSFHVDRELITLLDLKSYLSTLLELNDAVAASNDTKSKLQSAMAVLIEYIERDLDYKQPAVNQIVFNEGDFVRCNYYGVYGVITSIQANVNNSPNRRYPDQILIAALQPNGSVVDVVTSVKIVSDNSVEPYYLQKIADAKEFSSIVNKLVFNHFKKSQRTLSLNDLLSMTQK